MPGSAKNPGPPTYAKELGLEDQLISSNDATRKTYILIDGKLQAIPDGTRMMVPHRPRRPRQLPTVFRRSQTCLRRRTRRAEEL